MSKRIGDVACNIVICCVVLIVFAVAVLPLSVSVSENDGVYYEGSADKEVSLMVNVYWGNEYISEMLEIFREKQVTTTFFVGGMWVAENDDLLQKIYDDGHEIGNHGYYHKDQKELGYERNYEEINITHKLVGSILNYDMNLFAPPSGSYGDNTLQAAKILNYKVIMWTLDTIDWRDQDENLIFKRATDKIEGGSLVLMHPTKATVASLGKIIDEIRAKGLEITTVSNVIQISL